MDEIKIGTKFLHVFDNSKYVLCKVQFSVHGNADLAVLICYDRGDNPYNDTWKSFNGKLLEMESPGAVTKEVFDKYLSAHVNDFTVLEED